MFSDAHSLGSYSGRAFVSFAHISTDNFPVRRPLVKQLLRPLIALEAAQRRSRMKAHSFATNAHELRPPSLARRHDNDLRS